MLAHIALTMTLVTAPQPLPGDGWVRFEVPAVAETQSMGCNRSERASLKSRNDHWSINNGHGEGVFPDARFDRIHVYVEMQGGEIEDVRSFTPNCDVEGSDKAVIVQMDPETAVRRLGKLSGDDEMQSRVVATVAHIDHPDAFDALVTWAEDAGNEGRGEDALFWLAQRRGDAGRAIVQAHAGEGWPMDHREHAVMSLALTERPAAVEFVREVARESSSSTLRARAAMALGITHAPGALADLHSIFLQDTDPEVREQAIFGMSQLDNPAVAQTLADIVREPRFGEHRRQALFWLTNVEGEESEAVMDALVDDIF